jgi:hypothetical protein
MEIYPADIDLVVAARREVVLQRWRAVGSIALFFLSLILPWAFAWSPLNSGYCRGVGLGLFVGVLGMRSNCLNPLTVLAQRAINSTSQGIGLQAGRGSPENPLN